MAANMHNEYGMQDYIFHYKEPSGQFANKLRHQSCCRNIWTIQVLSRATYILHIFAGLYQDVWIDVTLISANSSPRYASMHWHNLFYLASPHLSDTAACAVRTFCNYWADINLKNMNRFLENFFGNTQWIQTKEHLEGKDVLTQVRLFCTFLWKGSS